MAKFERNIEVYAYTEIGTPFSIFLLTLHYDSLLARFREIDFQQSPL